MVPSPVAGTVPPSPMASDPWMACDAPWGGSEGNERLAASVRRNELPGSCDGTSRGRRSPTPPTGKANVSLTSPCFPPRNCAPWHCEDPSGGRRGDPRYVLNSNGPSILRSPWTSLYILAPLTAIVRFPPTLSPISPPWIPPTHMCGEGIPGRALSGDQEAPLGWGGRWVRRYWGPGLLFPISTGQGVGWGGAAAVELLGVKCSPEPPPPSPSEHGVPAWLSGKGRGAICHCKADSCFHPAGGGSGADSGDRGR